MSISKYSGNPGQCLLIGLDSEKLLWCGQRLNYPLLQTAAAIRLDKLTIGMPVIKTDRVSETGNAIGSVRQSTLF